MEFHGDVDSVSSDLYSFKKYTEHLQKRVTISCPENKLQHIQYVFWYTK